ncbi:MAG: hypothetical protein CVU26_07135 [Betaproteobacteria bacterium HGW-Betaproteobacteria-2]|nr:MAG: hypothetical protein CVU26_07135 [Betaproteobacteria bacterium HGW-Betaproteobacteria-2]
MPALLLASLLIIFSTSAHAQVYKCKNAENQIIYSDTPCLPGSQEIATDIGTLQPGNADPDAAAGILRQLDAAVKSAIAANDMTRANALATTEKHREWITAAIREQAQQPGKSPAELQAQKASSSECATAKRNLEAEANARASNPEVLSARKSLMYAACGIVEPVIIERQTPATMLYNYPYRPRAPYWDQQHQRHPERKRGPYTNKPDYKEPVTKEPGRPEQKKSTIKLPIKNQQKNNTGITSNLQADISYRGTSNVRASLIRINY